MKTKRYLQKLGLEPLKDGPEEGFKRPETEEQAMADQQDDQKKKNST